MVWGPMIAWYLFLAGASAGAFLTSAFVEAKYPESVKMRVAGRIIAPIFVGIGLLLLCLLYTSTSGAWCASFTDPTDNTVISHTSPNSSDSTRLATMSVTSEASAVR